MERDRDNQETAPMGVIGRCLARRAARLAVAALLCCFLWLSLSAPARAQASRPRIAPGSTGVVGGYGLGIVPTIIETWTIQRPASGSPQAVTTVATKDDPNGWTVTLVSYPPPSTGFGGYYAYRVQAPADAVIAANYRLVVAHQSAYAPGPGAPPASFFPVCYFDVNGYFRLGADPPALVIRAGKALESTVSVEGLLGFQGTVALSCPGTPGGGLQASVTPLSVSLSGSAPQAGATLTVTAPANATPGTYAVTVQGEHWGLKRAVGIPVQVIPPPPPPTLTATAGDEAVYLNWTTVGGGLYGVYRSTAAGTLGTQIGTVGAQTLNDYGVTNGTTYYYVVRALDLPVGAQDSNQASATPTAGPLQAPALSAMPGNGRVALTWTDGNKSGRVDEFLLRRKGPGESAYTQIAALGGGVRTYLDTSVTNGEEYCYTIVARGATRPDSDPSGEACARPMGPDFDLSVSPAPVTVEQGATGEATVAVVPKYDFSGTVDLEFLPDAQHPGLTGVLTTPSTTTGSPLSIRAGPRILPGTYTVQVRGTSPGPNSSTLTHAKDVTVQVVSPPIPPALACGEEAAGTLGAQSRASLGWLMQGYDGFHGARYLVTGPPGATVNLQLRSPDFDPLLYVLNADGTVASFNDNGPGTSQSALRVTLPASGSLVVEVTSAKPLPPDSPGRYLLTTCCEPEAPAAYPRTRPGRVTNLRPDGADAPEGGEFGPADWEVRRDGVVVATKTQPAADPAVDEAWVVAAQPRLDGSVAIQVTVPTGAQSGVYQVRLAGYPAATSAHFVVLCPDMSRPRSGGGIGLTGRYFGNSYFQANPEFEVGLAFTRIDPTINFNWDGAAPIAEVPNHYTVRWTGYLEPRTTGLHTFTVFRDDRVRIWLNGTLLNKEAWTESSPDPSYQFRPYAATVPLEAGVKYPIRVEFYQATVWGNIRLLWREPGQSFDEVIPTSQLYPENAVPDRFDIQVAPFDAAHPEQLWVTNYAYPSVPLTVAPVGLFSGNVALELQVPSEIQATVSGVFNPSPVAVGSESGIGDGLGGVTLQMNAAYAEPGVYDLVVKGTAVNSGDWNGLLDQETFALVVTRPPYSELRPRVPQAVDRSFPFDGREAPASGAGTWQVVAPWGDEVARGQLVGGTAATTFGWQVRCTRSGIFSVTPPRNAWVAAGYAVRARFADATAAQSFSAEFDVVRNANLAGFTPVGALDCFQSLPGTLAAGAPPSALGGAPADRYDVPVTASPGQTLTVTLTATDFAGKLHVFDPAGNLVGQAAAAAPGAPAQVVFTAARVGTYLVEVTTTNPALVGAYAVELACDYPWESAPNAPENLTAAATVAPDPAPGVRLTWEDASYNETGFRIELKTNDGKDWRLLAEVPADATGYAHVLGVDEKLTYTYRVRAYNDRGASGYSNHASFSHDGPPTGTLRIDAGGTPNEALIVPETGPGPWSADGDLASVVILGGAPQLFGGANDPLVNTTAPELYRTMRVGDAPFSYTFPAAEGAAYALNLHFAEPDGGSAGQERRFHVDVNGVRRLENFSIAGEAGGAGRALFKILEVLGAERTDGLAGGQVAVRFVPLPGSPPALVSALELVPLDPAALSASILCDEDLPGGGDPPATAGALDPSDPYSTLRPSGRYYADRYRFVGTKGKVVIVSLKAHQDASTDPLFDAHVTLIGPNGEVVAENDNFAGPTPRGELALQPWDAEVAVQLPETGTYTIEVTSAASNEEGGGAYRLALKCQDAQTGAPAAPAGLVADAAADPRTGRPSAVRLWWFDATPVGAPGGEEGFEVERSEGDRSRYQRIDTVSANVTSYLDGTVQPNRRYFYRVRAVVTQSGAAVGSAYTNEAAASTLLAPPVASILRPIPGTSVTAGQSVLVEVSAAAAGGETVAAVPVFVNGIPLGMAQRVAGSATRYALAWTAGVPGAAPGAAGAVALVAAVRTSGEDPASPPVFFSEPLAVTVLPAGSNGQLPPPVITAPTGTIPGGETPLVSIAAPVPTATILYQVTRGGSVNLPSDVNWRRYTGPFPVMAGSLESYPLPVRVWAKAVQSGLADSTVADVSMSLELPGGANPNLAAGSLIVPTDNANTHPRHEALDPVPVDVFLSGTVAYWALSYRRTEQAGGNPALDEYTWTDLSSGSALAVGAGPEAVFDPTKVPNGQYELRLRVFDNAGNFRDSFKIVVVRGGQKVGPFTLPLTDMTIPAPGFPVEITRVYDSSDAAAGAGGGDRLGAGWRLAVSNVRLEKSRTAPDDAPAGDDAALRVLGRGWKSGGGLGVGEDKPHLITITLPGGAVYPFYVKPQFAGFYGTVHFEPAPGVNATLTDASGDGGSALDPIYVFAANDPDGNGLDALVLSEEAGGDQPFDREEFELKTRDGTVYRIHARNGLAWARDRFGNRLTFDTDPQTGTSLIRVFQAGNATATPNRQVVITRGAGVGGFPRTEVYDEYDQGENNGGVRPKLAYQTDARGDLVAFTDRTGVTTHYAYDFEHKLLAVSKPGDANTVVLRNHYGPDGRLVATEDAEGRAVTQTHSVDKKRTVITDRMGNPSLLGYDAYGNVVTTAGYLVEPATSRATAVASTAEYGYNFGWDDIPDRKVYETDPLGRTSSFWYSTQGDLSESKDPLGRIDAFEYGEGAADGKVTEVRKVYQDPQLGSVDIDLAQNDYHPVTGLLLRSTTRLKAPPLAGQPIPPDTAAVTTYDDPSDPDDGYNADGSPRRVRDALGSATTYQYVTPIAGQPATFALAGNLLSVTDAANHATSYEYYTNGLKKAQVTSYRPRNDQGVPQAEVEIRTAYTYDASGRLKQTTSATGATSSTVYHASGKVWKRYDARGQETRYEYDDRGNLTETYHPDGTVTRTYYNANGQVVFSADRAGRVGATEYDTLGRTVATYQYERGVCNLTLTERPAQYGANGTPLFYASTRTAYDAAGRVIAQTDAKGNTTRSEYDEVGNLRFAYDAKGNKTEYRYDAFGRMKESVDPRANWGSEASILEHTSFFHYDVAGRQVKRMVPGVSGYSTTETRYDRLGRRLEEEDGAGRITAFRYDALGRLVAVIQVMDAARWKNAATPGFPDCTPGPDDFVTQYQYDEVGNKVAQFDAEDGRTNPSTGQPKNGVTRFGYDAGGRMRWRKLPLGQTEEIFYKADGSLDYKIDFEGRATKFLYDALGRLTAKYPVKVTTPPQVLTDPNPLADDEPGYAYTFYPATDPNAPGQRKTATYGNGTLEWQYDGRGQLGRVIGPNGTLAYAYDAAGNRTAVGRMPNATATAATWQVGYDFDENGQLKEVVYPEGGTVKTLYQYDPAGNLASVTRPNGVSTTYGHDLKNALTTVEQPVGYGYQTDATSKRTLVTETVTDPNDPWGYGGQTVLTRYVYDRAGRLTDEYTDRGTPSGQLKRTRYAYDRVGNRLSVSVALGTGSPSWDAWQIEYNNQNNGTSTWAVETTTAYLYDDNDRLTESLTTPASGPAMHKLYGYDDNGNQKSVVTSQGGVAQKQTLYEYTFEHKLRQQQTRINVAGAGQPTPQWRLDEETLFYYDASGNRTGVLRRDYDPTNIMLAPVERDAYYLVDATQPYAEVVEEWETEKLPGEQTPREVRRARYVLGHSRLRMDSQAALQGGGFSPLAAHYYLADGLGSTVALTDAQGALTDEWRYDAYGTPARKSGSVLNAFLFNGQQWDAGEELYFLRARYYGAHAGRFQSHDPLLGVEANPFSLHRYIYSENDPIDYIDPSGGSTESLGSVMFTLAWQGMLRGAAFGSIFGAGDAYLGGGDWKDIAAGAAQGAGAGAIFGAAGGVVGVFGKAWQLWAIAGANLIATAFWTADSISEGMYEQAAWRAAWGTFGLWHNKKAEGELPRQVDISYLNTLKTNANASLSNRAQIGGNVAAFSYEVSSPVRVAGEMVSASGSPRASRSAMGFTEISGETVYDVMSIAGKPRPGKAAKKAYPRHLDSEPKLLEEFSRIADGLGPNKSIRGTARLVSLYPVCDSCRWVIAQFRSRYPNIELIVEEGPTTHEH